MYIYSPRSRLRIWSREPRSAVPPRAGSLFLRIQDVSSGPYSRADLLPLAFLEVSIYYNTVNRHWPSPESILNASRVTGAAYSGNLVGDKCVSLFPRTYYWNKYGKLQHIKQNVRVSKTSFPTMMGLREYLFTPRAQKKQTNKKRVRMRATAASFFFFQDS